MRVQHLLPGLRPEPLASYLAGLGLIRVAGEQADPDAAAAWTPDGLVITSSVQDLAAWLAESYVPAPVLSPWNNGSGFGAKDKEPLRVLETIRKHPSPRFAPLQAAIPVAQEITGRGYPDKKSLVLAFRNRCPEAVLPWIDAAVVLTGQDPVFPPLLGTGGNDGRLDFSTNFHQRLLDVIGTPDSLAMARDLLTGTESQKLANAAIGQFDPASAGGPASSKFGAATSLVNPWEYVLFVEGALLFAASPVRRNQFAAGRAAMPFTVAASPDGSTSGAAGEESRGEVWAPLWPAELTLSEIRQLFAEARASWQGRQARRATDFYAATRTLGVARGISAFTRYGLQRRNGLAFAAVPLDRVDVRTDADVALAADVADWAGRFSGSDVSSAVGEASRAFQRAELEYARDGGPVRLARLLAALTTLEMRVGRSGRARDNAPVRFPPPAAKFLAVLIREASPELRVAAGLASIAGRGPDGACRSLRQLLLPVDPNVRWRESPVIAGFGVRPLPAVLADVLIWRGRTREDKDETGPFRGVPGFRRGIRVPAADLHDFAAGRLDGPVLDLYLRACLALNWRNVDPGWADTQSYLPVPTLGLLQPLAEGLPAGDESRLALTPGWAARLVAGQVADVHREAALRLRQAGWIAVPPPPRLSAADGVRIAAALVVRCVKPSEVLSDVAVKLKEES